MDKTKAQGKAIAEKYKEGSINKKGHERYDTEGGKEHKESNGYRMKKDESEEGEHMDKEGKEKKHKCSSCGMMH